MAYAMPAIICTKISGKIIIEKGERHIKQNGEYYFSTRR